MPDRHKSFCSYGSQPKAQAGSWKLASLTSAANDNKSKMFSNSLSDLVEHRYTASLAAPGGLASLSASRKFMAKHGGVPLIEALSINNRKIKQRLKRRTNADARVRLPFLAEVKEKEKDTKHTSSKIDRKKGRAAGLKGSASLPAMGGNKETQKSSGYLADVERKKKADMEKRQDLKWTNARYKAKLVNMTGPLRDYNAHIVFPQRYAGKGEVLKAGRDPNSRFMVEVNQYNEDQQMVVGPNNIYVLSVLQGSDLEDDPHAMTSAGLSVTETMQNICNQLKAAIRGAVAKAHPESQKKQGKQAKRKDFPPQTAVREVFASFDIDNNGVLDCKEMLIACQHLKLNISEDQIELIWPMLDSDGSGEVDIDEFFTIITHHENNLGAEKKQMTSSQRRRRIQERTDMAKHFLEVSHNVRTPVKAYMTKQNVSVKDFYRMVDEDGSGDIDKEELLQLLVKLKVPISMNELHLAFAAMDTDGDGGICEKEWNKFIKGGKKWELVHTEKMQQTKYLKRLQQIMMQPEY